MEASPGRRRLDRCGDERLDRDLVERLLGDPATLVLLWSPQGALVEVTADGPRLALVPAGGETVPAAEDARLAIFLGRDDAGAAWVALIHNADTRPEPPAGTGNEPMQPVWLGLRDIGHELPAMHADAFMTTQALASWHLTHGRCPRCGAPTTPINAGWVRRCEADGSEHYPRSDPAVIMAVLDPDDRLLLARAPAWPQNRRSVLAGFVEPGEPLEVAVAREVHEEVGLRVHDVRYFDSQPWPFPASLMLGFTARTDDATLRIDDSEIVAAEWYTRDDLRRSVASGDLGLPGRLSIARRLIESWYGERLTPPREVAFHRPDEPTTDTPSSGR